MTSLGFLGDAGLTASDACIDDLTMPTFAGIATLTANPDGSITPTWIAASGGALPTRYALYVQAATATGLFSSSNRIPVESETLEAILYRLRDSTKLEAGILYFVAVRAISAVGIEDSNTASLSVISTGVLDDNCATLGQKVNQLLSAAAPELTMELDGNELQMELEDCS